MIHNKYYNNYSQFFDYFHKIIKEDKLSHAFLIECRNVNNYKEIILMIIKEILESNKYNEDLAIENLVENNNYPELKIIEPINHVIRKEQLLNLQKEFSVQSIYGRYLIYIIDGAEYLNKSSANTILKFLEEPPSNIIAFLLTNNNYNVIETIASRCQKITLGEIKHENAFSPDVQALAEILENKKDKALGYIDNSWYSFDRESLIIRLKELQNYYLFQLTKIKQLRESSNIKALSNISKKIIIIDDCLNKLRYNVNIKLLIDKFILSMVGVI